MKSLGMTLVAAASVAASVGALLATGKGPARVRASARSLPPSIVTYGKLPALPKGHMKVTKHAEAISVLQFDDNTCESGLGAGVQVSSLVEFDPSPPCTTPALIPILNVTARMNTNAAQDFVFHNPGATPQMANAATVTQPLSAPIAPSGPCPATGGLAQRVLTTPVAGAPGTAVNFFAGIRNTGFAGLDTTPPNANRIWLTCSVCGMTIYSPADLNALGLGGNWLIRVTIEDLCVPVELQHMEVSD
jgi:hypothetical protein